MGAIAPFRDIGPCQVLFNAIELGETLDDGVNFKIATPTADVKENRTGNTPVDSVHTGTIIGIDIIITRFTVAQLIVAIPGAAALNAGITVSNLMVGSNLYDVAQTLILKPIIAGIASTDEDHWITFQKAAITTNGEIKFNVEGQRVLALEVKIFPDATSGKFGDIGDVSAP